jgi:hypothetical protein
MRTIRGTDRRTLAYSPGDLMLLLAPVPQCRTRFAVSLVACTLSVALAGCATRSTGTTGPAPARAAVAVEFETPRDVIVRLDDASARTIPQAERILGTVQHHDADSLVLEVTSIRTRGAEERFSDATLRLAGVTAGEVTVLSTRPRTTNWLATLAIPAVLALGWLMYALLVGGEAT